MLTRFTKAAVGAAAALALAAPAANAACEEQAFSQVFSPWQDSLYYALIPNGDFEAGLTGWDIQGKAHLVWDQPTAIADQMGDTQSLELPPRSSATTPPICVGAGYPTSRMFGNTVVTTPDSGSTLKIEVIYTDATRGGQTVKKLGTAPDEAKWNPARKMSIAQGQLNIKPDSNGNTYIRYRFTPLYGTTWRIDDVYVDPRLRG